MKRVIGGIFILIGLLAFCPQPVLAGELDIRTLAVTNTPGA